MIETNALVKRMLGNEWNARDGRKIEAWARKYGRFMPASSRRVFTEVVLNGRNQDEVARELGIARNTLRVRLFMANQMMGFLARTLPRRRYNGMFVSVFEHEFGEEVTTRELSETLFGWYDRRSTQTIHVNWLPKVRSGELDLPEPVKKGKSWVWTKDQAEAWRRWYVSLWQVNDDSMDEGDF